MDIKYHTWKLFEQFKAYIRKNKQLCIAVILQKNVFSTKLLRAYVQYVYIVYVKHWINSSKAVVGVDWPTKVLNWTYGFSAIMFLIYILAKCVRMIVVEKN